MNVHDCAVAGANNGFMFENHNLQHRDNVQTTTARTAYVTQERFLSGSFDKELNGKEGGGGQT